MDLAIDTAARRLKGIGDTALGEEAWVKAERELNAAIGMTAEQQLKKAEADIKAQEAAKKHNEEIQKQVDILVGKKLAQEIADLAEALTRAGGASHITTYEASELGKELEKLWVQGAKLTPELDAVMKAHLSLNSVLPTTNEWFRNLVATLDKAHAPTMVFHSTLNELAKTGLNGLSQALAGTEAHFALINQALPDASHFTASWFEHSVIATKSTNDLAGALRGAGQMFAELAQIGGDSFGPILRAIGQTTVAAGQLSSAMKDLNDPEKGGMNPSNLASVAAGWVGVATAVASVVTGLIQHFTAGRKAVEDFAESAGGFDKLHTQLLTLGAAGEALWVKLTQGVDKGNPEQAKKVIAEVQKALDTMIPTLDAVFDVWRRGLLSTSDATAILNKHWDDLVGGASSGSGLLSQAFLEMVGKIDDAGGHLEKLHALLTTQTTSAIGGLETFLNAATVTSEQSATAIGNAVAGLFSALTAEGVSVTEAIKKVTPVVNALEAQLTETGFSGGLAFEHLEGMVKIASDKIAGPALDAVGGLNAALVGMNNIGLLDQETFAGLTKQVADTFEALTKQGYDGNDVLKLMQPTLQTIWELEEKFGFKTDEATQALVDQARQQGIVGETHKSIAVQMLDLTDRMTKAIEALAKHFGVDLPASIDETGRRADDVFRGVKKAIDDVPTDITITFDGVFIPPTIDPETGMPNPQAAGGDYFVTQPTLFLAGEAGPEAVSFSGANNARGWGGVDVSGVEDRIDNLGRTLTTVLPKIMRDAMRQSQ